MEPVQSLKCLKGECAEEGSLDATGSEEIVDSGAPGLLMETATTVLLTAL